MSSATRKVSSAAAKPGEPLLAASERRHAVRTSATNEVGTPHLIRKGPENGVPGDIKRVPQPKSLREQLRRHAVQLVAQVRQSASPTKPEFERLARRLLADMSLSDCFVGWTMVMLASAYWEPNVRAIPIERRLLLLPGSLRHLPNCAADSIASDIQHTTNCAACDIDWLRSRAATLGYQILWVEDAVAVLAAISRAEVDAVVGVASLDLLEKAVDQIPQFELPCMAIPLLDHDSPAPLDADWIARMIELPYVPADSAAPNYRHLMRAARQMFDPAELERLAPSRRPLLRLAELNGNAAAALDPLTGTEAIAYDFLTRGGKHSRPFITLAVYDAMTGGLCTSPDGHRHVGELPLAVKRAAVSIETFHKASLVHDDIEDDDEFRYGTATLHRAFGVSTAINVGDFLIGLGYRLVSRESGMLGAEVVSDIVDRLADAHMKLTEGQGAELLWRDLHRTRLTPSEAIEIYALKTAPAFEAALITGVRLAGPSGAYLKPIGEFARHLGIAFQILNDLADWTADNHNKLVAAGDVLGGRPTVLWALALVGLPEAGRSRLEKLAGDSAVSEATISEIRGLYEAADVFDKAEQLVKEYQQRAREVAESVHCVELRRLLNYLIDIVLQARR